MTREGVRSAGNVIEPQPLASKTQRAGTVVAWSEFLIGAAIGSGNTGLAAELGGANFLLAINAGRLRNMGAPSIACMLPVFDACADTEAFARAELLPQVRIPVLLGVNVWGQRFDPQQAANSARDDGFAGAVNFPSCMHYSRPMQQILSRAGRGIEQEVEQLRAVQDAGLISMFYCATRTQARLAADAGLDLVCLNLGWNAGGAFGHRKRSTLEEVATIAREIGRLMKRINPATRFLLEGGPIASAEDLGRIVSLAPIDGYVGGSTIDRIPMEVSIANQIDGFRRAGRRRSTLDRDSARLVAWSKKFGFVGRSTAQLGFLRRLRALASTSGPVLLGIEKGSNPASTISALAQRRGKTGGRNVLHVDVTGEEFPTRARNVLFGNPGMVAGQSPALADSDLNLLVIHSPVRLPPAVQRRLAHALRDGEFRVSGSRRLINVAPRVILIADSTETPRPADECASDVSFDRELAALMAGVTLRLPPLRERIEDLLLIIAKVSREILGTALRRADFSTAALQLLQGHPWPGNDTELRVILGRLAGRVFEAPVQREDLLPLLREDAVSAQDARTEKDRIVEALWRHGFRRTRTAASLGISRKTLYNKMLKFGLSG